MVHNGVEYGMMQAYAEGFELFDECEYDLDNAKIAHLWMQGSVVRSWLCELAALAFEQEGNDLERSSRTSRTPARAAGRSRTRSSSDIPTPVITTSLFERFSSRGQGDVHRQGERRAAQPVRRPRGHEEELMATVEENPLAEGLERLPVHPTTLVIFGATGDLAQAQAPAGDLQPRPRGLAPRAVPPDRRLARRDLRRGVPGLARESIGSTRARARRPTVLDALMRARRAT